MKQANFSPRIVNDITEQIRRNNTELNGQATIEGFIALKIILQEALK